MGTDGVYTLTTPYERDDKCPICSPGVSYAVQPSTTLRQVRLLCLDLKRVPHACASWITLASSELHGAGVSHLAADGAIAGPKMLVAVQARIGLPTSHVAAASVHAFRAALSPSAPAVQPQPIAAPRDPAAGALPHSLRPA